MTVGVTAQVLKDSEEIVARNCDSPARTFRMCPVLGFVSGFHYKCVRNAKTCV